MKSILDYPLAASDAALWWLGQAGYLLRSSGITIAIDPYLSDSAAKDAAEFSRLYAPPLQPEQLNVDVYVVTHDHLDHLDPETISRYAGKESTWFVAPRQAAQKLVSLGVPDSRLVVLHAGDTWRFQTVEITGVFAIPTGVDVLDTTGYRVRFDNGRSIYHTSDTAFHPLVPAAAPKMPEVMLVPINGKWGNPGPEAAALFAKEVQPRYVMPNHYDLMFLNSENPETFKWYCLQHGMEKQCVLPVRMQPFIWNDTKTSKGAE